MNFQATKDQKGNLEMKKEGGMITFDYAETKAEVFKEKAILDSLEAIKWAYAWTGYGTDEEIDEYINIFTHAIEIRQDPVMVKQMYLNASTVLAMKMTAGTSFQNAVIELTANKTWATNFMSEYYLAQGANVDRRARPYEKEWPPAKRQKTDDKEWKPVKKERAETYQEACAYWAKGNCMRGARCPYRHGKENDRKGKGKGEGKGDRKGKGKGNKTR